MRIVFIDIDSLRPDHLGCYGYHRATSPNIDRIAAEGLRFDNCYASDAPCLPSRTALFSGRFGIHTGVVGGSGEASAPFPEGAGFHTVAGRTSWMTCLRECGYRTVTVSSFGERHSAWQWYSGFSETHNPHKRGWEHAEDLAPIALRWIERNGREDDWFLHVNLWDPHTQYRTPQWFGEPFAEEPLPEWLTEDIRRGHWDHGGGPVSARERDGLDGGDAYSRDYPRQPGPIESMAEVRRMFDGYDTAVLFADRAVGLILDALEARGLLDETAVIVSADHGEALGEMNVYGCHQLADHVTSRVPLIIRWPGVTAGGGVRSALHYHVDFAASVIELAGGRVPPNWDARSFAASLRAGEDAGRGHLIVSQGAASCQRSVRFDDYICIRTYHDGLHGLPDVMLFDVAADPHQLDDLAGSRGDLVARAMILLEDWHGRMMRTATHPRDPMWTVVAAGGPAHSRGRLEMYLQRLRQTGRDAFADMLEEKHIDKKSDMLERLGL